MRLANRLLAILADVDLAARDHQVNHHVISVLIHLARGNTMKNRVLHDAVFIEERVACLVVRPGVQAATALALF